MITVVWGFPSPSLSSSVVEAEQLGREETPHASRANASRESESTNASREPDRLRIFGKAHDTNVSIEIIADLAGECECESDIIRGVVG